MVKKRETGVPRKLKRNPMVRALSSPLFRERLVERPDKPRRRPKYRKPPENEAEDDP
jgi:hypothetical protein